MYSGRAALRASLTRFILDFGPAKGEVECGFKSMKSKQIPIDIIVWKMVPSSPAKK
jgi:hypothetical protein